MNSHFQSSETTSTLSGGAADWSGLLGSRSWLPIQAMPPSRMTVSAGIDHTTNSIAPEYSQFGPVLRLLVAAPEPPGEGDCGDDHRDDDRQHDRGRVDEDQLLGVADGPDGIEHAAGCSPRSAARQQISSPCGVETSPSPPLRWAALVRSCELVNCPLLRSDFRRRHGSRPSPCSDRPLRMSPRTSSRRRWCRMQEFEPATFGLQNRCSTN